MRTDDFPQFSEIIEDLCAAFNKPASDRLVRVFFEDLKGVDLRTVRNLAQIWRKTQKKFPSPNDLRPKGGSDSEKAQAKPGEKTIQVQLCEFAARYYAPHTGKTTPRQFGQPWNFIFRRHQWFDEKEKRNRDEYAICVGVIIPAAPDGSKPSYRIMVDDMQLGAAA